MNTSLMKCHSYIFLDADSVIADMSKTHLEKLKKDFEKYIVDHQDTKDVNMSINFYSTLGFKAGTRFMLHINAVTPEEIQIFIRDILHTPLGKYLKITYTLFGIIRESPYKPKNTQPESAEKIGSHRYLIVYPFTKTIDWHLLPQEERGAIMKAHVGVGRKWSGTVAQLLLYSYGIDDHEFIVSYYTDKIEDFQSLVMDMRSTESRRHTKNDLPIFTCIHASIKEVLSMI